jgi:hypothetical protein
LATLASVNCNTRERIVAMWANQTMPLFVAYLKPKDEKSATKQICNKTTSPYSICAGRIVSPKPEIMPQNKPNKSHRP